MENNKFSPKTASDFPLLGFPTSRTGSPSVTGISLQVPFNNIYNTDLDQLKSPISSDSLPVINEPNKQEIIRDDTDKNIEWL